MKDLKASYKTVMADSFPETFSINFGDQTLLYKKRTWKIEEEGELVEKGLRYGENPGQQAALYELVNGNLVLGDCSFITSGNSLVSSITEEQMLQFGKHPGKTNLTDIDSSLNILKYLAEKPACVIVKHNNPSGVAIADNVYDSFYKALMCDRVASFGGGVTFNRPVDKKTAELISENYFEVIAAPCYEEGVVDILKKRKNLRIVEIQKIDKLIELRDMRFVDFKSLMDGGLILQQSPLNSISTPEDLFPAECTYKGETYKVERQALQAELNDMVFGWAVEQGVTSNSVIFVKDGATVAIGTGEQDRVGVADIAVYKAYTKFSDRIAFEKYGRPYTQIEREVNTGNEDKEIIDEIQEVTKLEKAGLKNSCMVSDAFFPFRDGVDVGINQGITSIVQPGGSLRDFEAIVACNEASPQIAMMFTGQRAFKH